MVPFEPGTLLFLVVEIPNCCRAGHSRLRVFRFCKFCLWRVGQKDTFDLRLMVDLLFLFSVFSSTSYLFLFSVFTSTILSLPVPVCTPNVRQ